MCLNKKVIFCVLFNYIPGIDTLSISSMGFKEYEFEAEELVRLSLILAGTGYFSLSKYFLTRSKLLENKTINDLYKKIHNHNWKKKFLYNWNHFPIWLKRKIFN